MVDTLLNIDIYLFVVFNQSFANPVFDLIMPAITDWDKSIVGRIIAILIVIGLVWKGGEKGRLVIILLIPTIILSDQISSSILKKIITRPRPCHLLDGVMVIENVRLLVNCGSGYSFPSSHAVNHFATATIFTLYYPRLWWGFGTFALIIGFSRIYVGVHFPFDVFAGALIGIICGLIIYALWKLIKNKIITQRK